MTDVIEYSYTHKGDLRVNSKGIPIPDRSALPIEKRMAEALGKAHYGADREFLNIVRSGTPTKRSLMYIEPTEADFENLPEYLLKAFLWANTKISHWQPGYWGEVYKAVGGTK